MLSYYQSFYQPISFFPSPIRVGLHCPTLCLSESLCAGLGAAVEDGAAAAACWTGDTTADTLAVARPPPLPPAEAAPVSPVLDACLGVCGRHLCCLTGAVGAAAEVLAAVSITGLLLLWFSLCCWSSVGSLISADSGLPSSGMKGATTCTGLPGDAALPGSSCVVVVFRAATDQLAVLPRKELTEPLLLVGV